MITALYVVGTETVEIGRFGMNLQDAKTAFLKMAEDLGVKPKRIDGATGKITVNFWAKGEEPQPGLDKLLNKAANVVSATGDPPTTYFLEAVDDVAPGSYLRTTQYKD